MIRDALKTSERDVLNAWDAGHSVDQIVAATGIPSRRVLATIEKFDSESNWRERARAATQRLGAACLASGGSFA